MTRNVETIMHKAGLNKLTRQVTNWWKKETDDSDFGPEQNEMQRLYEWLTLKSALADEVLQRTKGEAAQFSLWVQGLSQDELTAFCESLTAFCESVHIELSWLIDPHLNSDVAMKDGLEELVLLYTLAYWRAQQVQENVQAFAAFQAWWHSPLDKEHQALTRRVFARLEDRQLLPPPSPTLVLSDEAERRQYVIQSIKSVMARDPQMLAALFHEVRAEQAAAAAPPPAPAETAVAAENAEPEPQASAAD